MYYDLLKQITVFQFGKNELGIHVTYMMNSQEKNLAYPASEADDILLDAVGVGFSDLEEFSQHDAIEVAAIHEERLERRKVLQVFDMGSFANAVNN